MELTMMQIKKKIVWNEARLYIYYFTTSYITL